MTGGTDLARCSLAELGRLLAAGAATSETIVEACLSWIAAREPSIHAWAHLDPELALVQARARDRETSRGSLHGLPVAIKDIIDTADQPTQHGSPIYAGHRPPRDAACVALLRRAGAVILGKTATTEFAAASPAATINPHAAGHTPGGSSSGSAAAVADFMVPAGLGTQTLGSIIRPASYCGIVGFKPSYGLVPVDGVKPSAPTMDTVGFLLRRAEDIPLLLTALTRSIGWETKPPAAPRFVFLRGPQWDKAQAETLDAIARARESFLRSGATVEEQDCSSALETLRQSAWTILSFENAQNWAYEYDFHRPSLSPVLAEFLDRAAMISRADYASALAAADAARRAIDRILSACDAVLTAAAPGEAPAGLVSTGDTVFNGAWTLAHLPCVTLPAGAGPNGLPVGIQLIARRGGDAMLAALARWAETRCLTA
jgi:Asp-tRNA(Asn)/Glu-tRNA(Gln) amidotransferase A subunit family amidase